LRKQEINSAIIAISSNSDVTDECKDQIIELMDLAVSLDGNKNDDEIELLTQEEIGDE
jgi:hypothetical protein